jgi:hypothetical protein
VYLGSWMQYTSVYSGNPITFELHSAATCFSFSGFVALLHLLQHQEPWREARETGSEFATGCPAWDWGPWCWWSWGAGNTQVPQVSTVPGVAQGHQAAGSRARGDLQVGTSIPCVPVAGL